MTLTIRNREVLEGVKTWIAVNGCSPSVGELGELLGMKSKSTVWGHLTQLKAEGYVDWKPGLPRTLRLTEDEARMWYCRATQRVWPMTYGPRHCEEFPSMHEGCGAVLILDMPL